MLQLRTHFMLLTSVNQCAPDRCHHTRTLDRLVKRYPGLHPFTLLDVSYEKLQDSPSDALERLTMFRKSHDAIHRQFAKLMHSQSPIHDGQ